MSEQLQVPVECEVPEGWEVVCVRRPNVGDAFLDSEGRALACVDDYKLAPRLILRRVAKPMCELGEITGGRVEFRDTAGDKCQVHSDGHRAHVFGFGDDGVYLDRPLAAKLAAVLQRFADTGTLAKPADEKADEWQWPSWLTAPWIAMDSDGAWRAFASEPFYGARVWFGPDATQRSNFTPPPCTDWRQSKRKNPNL